MLQHIPTYLLAGPLGAGKTSLLQHWLAHKPSDERWALLINEFGQLGLDAALLDTAVGSDSTRGVHLREVAGGCVCCVNGVPLQVGLTRLLREAKPHRLLIETSGLGHPLTLLKQLDQAPWQGVLALQPLIMLLDAQRLQRGEALSDIQAASLAAAGVVLLNKTDGLSSEQVQALLAELPAHTQTCQYARVPCPAPLPAPEASTAPAALPQVKTRLNDLPSVWLNPQQPQCVSHLAAEGWSIGWRWHPSQHFDLTRLGEWLSQQSVVRAKGIVQTADGAFSCNVLPPQPLRWQPSAWAKDSRVELILAQAGDAQALTAALSATLATAAR
ncbi:CobW family GTP-binding protein [Atopomonas sediminilitoris]|uniref:CobW family GTP-binding protein n=1 Tax=Atopomonas sediminilitoris TaxID=2919919 RepID=UPI001F4DD618|nr:CobW family GTP-binding protein [Atopomonas sediminilitoris]MCJ8169464.1 CobW family GTP-binding protein [Atopomonas sediminilitoris]